MLWTIQHKSIIDTIDRTGIYTPDFSLSNPNYPGTYKLLLKVSDLLNPDYRPLKGLIFTFDDSPTTPLASLADVTSFFKGHSTRQHFIDKNPDCRLFNSTEYYILALDELTGFNSMPLDIALFTVLSDYIDAEGNFPRSASCNEELLFFQKWNDALNWWLTFEGFSEWLFQSCTINRMNILERHLPFIKKKQILIKLRMDKLGIIPMP